MELEIWPDAWTLPSIDPECIAIFYYLHLIVFGSGQDSRVINSFDPSGSANGRSWRSQYIDILFALKISS